MITSLTDEQKAKFPEYVARWTAIGLSTEPADRPRAEAAIEKMYAVAGLSKPCIVWCGSPLSQGFTRAILLSQNASVGDSVRASVEASVEASVSDSIWASVGASVWASVRASVWARVGDSVWASVGASVWASVRASVGDNVSDSVRASVEASVWASVRDRVWDSVWEIVKDSVSDSVSDSVRDSVRASIYGSHDSNWLAFYRFFHDECGLVKVTENLSGLWELCQSAGWALPHEKVCWVSERHNVLNRNSQGRLHCEDGPAMVYPDGWRLWYVHGVAVDEQIVMRPDSQTIEQIHFDENMERRRVRIERFGWPRYLAGSGAKRVHQRRNDRDAQTEELFRMSDGTQRFVCVDPSTGRRYALGVPREIETCEQAQLWMSHGLDSRAIHRS